MAGSKYIQFPDLQDKYDQIVAAEQQMTPLDDANLYRGRVFAKASPLAGLAKMGEKLLAGYQKGKVDEDYKTRQAAYLESLKSMAGSADPAAAAAMSNNPDMAGLGAELLKAQMVAKIQAANNPMNQLAGLVLGGRTPAQPSAPMPQISPMPASQDQSMVDHIQPNLAKGDAPQADYGVPPALPVQGMASAPAAAFDPNKAMGAQVLPPTQNTQPMPVAPQTMQSAVDPIDRATNALITKSVGSPTRGEGYAWQYDNNGRAIEVPDPMYKYREKKALDDALLDMQADFDKLHTRGDITSTEKPAWENIFTSLTSGKPDDGLLKPIMPNPQAIARGYGSQSQGLRDDIEAKRVLIKQLIANASGMSAGAMNSDKELQALLAAMGDTSKLYETNKNVLANASKRYGAGTLAHQPEKEAGRPSGGFDLEAYKKEKGLQ